MGRTLPLAYKTLPSCMHNSSISCGVRTTTGNKGAGNTHYGRKEEEGWRERSDISPQSYIAWREYCWGSKNLGAKGGCLGLSYNFQQGWEWTALCLFQQSAFLNQFSGISQYFVWIVPCKPN